LSGGNQIVIEIVFILGSKDCAARNNNVLAKQSNQKTQQNSTLHFVCLSSVSKLDRKKIVKNKTLEQSWNDRRLETAAVRKINRFNEKLFQFIN
jgi:hypothetical protein